jgi:hypothetical protein
LSTLRLHSRTHARAGSSLKQHSRACEQCTVHDRARSPQCHARPGCFDSITKLKWQVAERSRPDGAVPDTRQHTRRSQCLVWSHLLVKKRLAKRAACMGRGPRAALPTRRRRVHARNVRGHTVHGRFSAMAAACQSEEIELFFHRAVIASAGRERLCAVDHAIHTITSV